MFFYSLKRKILTKGFLISMIVLLVLTGGAIGLYFFASGVFKNERSRLLQSTRQMFTSDEFSTYVSGNSAEVGNNDQLIEWLSTPGQAGVENRKLAQDNFFSSLSTNVYKGSLNVGLRTQLATGENNTRFLVETFLNDSLAKHNGKVYRVPKVVYLDANIWKFETETISTLKEAFYYEVYTTFNWQTKWDEILWTVDIPDVDINFDYYEEEMEDSSYYNINVDDPSHLNEAGFGEWFFWMNNYSLIFHPYMFNDFFDTFAQRITASVDLNLLPFRI